MNIAELKTLLISARNELNSMLSLSRSKKILYEEQQYFDLVTFLSLWNVAAEDGSKVMNVLDDVPSGDAMMQQLQKLSLEGVEGQFDRVFERQAKKLLKKKRKPKAIAIIDVHEQETHSKEKRTSPDIRGGKHKNGTNFFFKFATIQILYKGKVVTLKAKLHSRTTPLKHVVEQLVRHAQRFVKIKVLLLDRGFRDTCIINDLEFLRVPLLMPCIKDKKAKRLFEESTRAFRVVKYYWRNVKGEYADFKLVMMKLDNRKEIGFYTTMWFPSLRSPAYFLNLYAKRWNIETGYRLQNQLLPRTTCIKGAVRYFYFCYAIAMHNLWLCIRNSVNKKTPFTVMRMKFILVYFWITTHLNPKL